MTRLFQMFLCTTFFLSACAGTPDLRYAVPPVDASDRIGISYNAVEVTEVTLPRYGEEELIFRETQDGALESAEGLLWADAPARSITLELTRHLAALTGATVASSPWPFADRADVRVEVRVEEFLADPGGDFRLSGQAFVAPQDSGRGRSEYFRLTAPIAPDSGIAGVVAARAQVVLDLARLLARQGLR